MSSMSFNGFVHTSKRHVSSFFMADIASDKIIAESLSPFAKVNSMFHTIQVTKGIKVIANLCQSLPKSTGLNSPKDCCRA